MKSEQFNVVRRIALILLVALMVAGAWLAPLESTANQTIDAGLKRALISFATARALNGVISVAQATQVAIEPGGVGVNFGPGELLDPLNDLIEHFGNLMLTASVALVVEKILVSIGAHHLISALLTISALLWAAFHLRRNDSPALLSRILLLLLMIRFALPLALIGSDALFAHFMQEDYQSSQRAIDGANDQFDQLEAAGPDEASGVLDKFRNWVAQNADIQSRLKQLKQAAENTTEHVITLMAIFALQTLLLPLLLFWLLWTIAKGIFVAPAPFPSRYSINQADCESVGGSAPRPRFTSNSTHISALTLWRTER